MPPSPATAASRQRSATEGKSGQQANSPSGVAGGPGSDTRSRLGAIQHRLNGTTHDLDIAAENRTATESRIRDADSAAETLLMTRNQMLQQSGMTALAQANQLPQTVLQLLR